jgi:hypothetical protein
MGLEAPRKIRGAAQSGRRSRVTTNTLPQLLHGPQGILRLPLAIPRKPLLRLALRPTSASGRIRIVRLRFRPPPTPRAEDLRSFLRLRPPQAAPPPFQPVSGSLRREVALAQQYGPSRPGHAGPRSTRHRLDTAAVNEPDFGSGLGRYSLRLSSAVQSQSATKTHN